MDTKRVTVWRAEERAFDGDPLGAAQVLLEHLSEDREDPEIWFLMGHYLMEAGELTDAAHALIECLFWAPRNGLAHYELANCYRSLGREQLADDHYKRACKLLEYDPDTVADYGLSKLTAGQPADAFRLFKEALEIDTRCALARLGLACFLFQMGDYKESLKECEALLADNPDSLDAQELRRHITAAILLPPETRAAARAAEAPHEEAPPAAPPAPALPPRLAQVPQSTAPAGPIYPREPVAAPEPPPDAGLTVEWVPPVVEPAAEEPALDGILEEYGAPDLVAPPETGADTPLPAARRDDLPQAPWDVGVAKHATEGKVHYPLRGAWGYTEKPAESEDAAVPEISYETVSFEATPEWAGAETAVPGGEPAGAGAPPAESAPADAGQANEDDDAFPGFFMPLPGRRSSRQ